MADSDQQKAIKKLEARVKENTDEIVAIRGLLKALLLESKETEVSNQSMRFPLRTHSLKKRRPSVKRTESGSLK